VAALMSRSPCLSRLFSIPLSGYTSLAHLSTAGIEPAQRGYNEQSNDAKEEAFFLWRVKELCATELRLCRWEISAVLE
jgi:hypothetical protein